MKKSIKRLKDQLTIFGQYTFTAMTTIHQKPNGAYDLKFEFKDLSEEEQANLNYLGGMNIALPFSSEIIGVKNEADRFVVAKRKTKAQKMIWHCHCFYSKWLQQFAT